jgi:type IV pilus assembly protein PilC
MLFKYQAKTQEGELRNGSIEAASIDAAVSALQRRGLFIVTILPEDESVPFYARSFTFLERVKQREIVIISRQLATLFQAKVPIVESLKIIFSEVDSPLLKRELYGLLEDIQGGASMSQSMARHPKVFSSFYINMVRSGEESGKLEEIFSYLADYLERNYELTSKARNALIYPAFVLVSFIGVMILMLTVIIPNLAEILTETGQQLPIYTRIVIGASEFFATFGILVAVAVGVLGVFIWRFYQTENGRMAIHRLQIAIPLFGLLYRKLYMSRIADNLQTLISGGIPVVRALEITSDVVGSEVFRSIILDVIESVKGGSSISNALSRHPDIPSLMSQMIRIGEETGRLDSILDNLASFYRKEVNSLVDNLVNLIEPIMILLLGGGVGVLVASVLVPLYNITGSF